MKTYKLFYTDLYKVRLSHNGRSMLCFDGTKKIFPFLEHWKNYTMDISKRPLKRSKKLEFATGDTIALHDGTVLYGPMCDAVISMLGQDVDRGFLYIRLTIAR